MVKTENMLVFKYLLNSQLKLKSLFIYFQASIGSRQVAVRNTSKLPNSKLNIVPTLYKK